MKVDFDMIFRFNAAQIGCRTLCKWVLHDFPFKGGSALDCRALWIFHFKVDQNSVAEHYEIDFDMIFRLNAAQNLILEHYIIEFYMIFHFKAAQNMVAEHYERDFDTIFYFMVAQKVVAEHYGRGWVTGLTPMTMNQNRFNLVDSVLDNFIRKKARRL